MTSDPRRDAAPGLAESTAFAIMMAIAAYLGRENPRFVYPQILWSFLGLMAANLLHFSILPKRLPPAVRARVSIALNSLLVAVILRYSGGRESYFWVMFLWPLFSAVVTCEDAGVLGASVLAMALLAAFYADSVRRGIWAEILEMLVKMLTLVAAVGMAARVAAAERRARRELVEEQERALRERLEARDKLAHMDRLATLGTLSAGIAHELNGPLTAILGFAEAEGADGPDEAPRVLRRIAANARRCRDTISNTLAFARRGRVERAPSDLNALVRQCVTLKKSDWVGLDLAVEEAYAEPLPPVPVSGPELQQVVFNLLTNADQALRSAGRGGARIRVSTGRSAEWAWITAEDNGPGIPPDVLERIWEPFFTTKPVGVGTGLGLSICRRIVEGHGGRLRVESKPGRTAFTIELPLAAPPPAAAGN